MPAKPYEGGPPSGGQVGLAVKSQVGRERKSPCDFPSSPCAFDIFLVNFIITCWFVLLDLGPVRKQ